MYDEIIRFCDYTVEQEKDQYGDPVQNPVISEAVFAKVKSISQSEFYQAQTSDAKPELKFVIPDYLEYGGQQYLIYGEKSYKVLRTYRTGNELEITCYGGVRDVSAAVSDEN